MAHALCKGFIYNFKLGWAKYSIPIEIQHVLLTRDSDLSSKICLDKKRTLFQYFEIRDSWLRPLLWIYIWLVMHYEDYWIGCYKSLAELFLLCINQGYSPEIFNSFVPGRLGCDFKNPIFNFALLIGIFRSSNDWLCPVMNATGPYWW